MLQPHIQVHFFPEHVCLKLWLFLIWYTLSRPYTAQRQPMFPTYICKCSVPKQEKCYISTPSLFVFFNILCILQQIPPLGDWFSKKSVNHNNLHNNILYKNANFISLGKIFDMQDTFRRGRNSMRNLATQAIIQNIQKIPITQTVHSVL